MKAALWAGVAAVCVALSGAAAPAARAQDFGESETWEYEFAAHFWFVAVEGDGAVQGQSFPLDVGPESAFNFALESHRGAWSLAVEAAYVGVEDDITFANGTPGTFRVENFLPGVTGGYRLFASSSARVEALAGFRYTDLELTASADTVAAIASKSWFDPLAGLRLRGRIAERWTYALRGDVGGFGVGSDLAYNLFGGIAFQTSPRLVVALGYRYYDTDYQDGSGSDLFVYDARQHGAQAGIVLLF